MSSPRGGRGTATRSWATHTRYRNRALEARQHANPKHSVERGVREFPTGEVAEELGKVGFLRCIVEHHEEPAARGAGCLHDGRDEQQEERNEGLHRGQSGGHVN